MDDFFIEEDKMKEFLLGKRKNNSVIRLVLTATFAALSILVGLLQIPWFPPFNFLKIDFSEVIILISLLTLGFSNTTNVIILRSVIRELVIPDKLVPFPFFGEFVAIYASLVLISLYKLVIVLTGKKQPKNITDGLEPLQKEPLWKILVQDIFVIAGFTVALVALNYFFTVPIQMSLTKHFFFVPYIKSINQSVGTYTLFVLQLIGPFNIVKGIATFVVFELTKTGLTQAGIL